MGDFIAGMILKYASIPDHIQQFVNVLDDTRMATCFAPVSEPVCIGETTRWPTAAAHRNVYDPASGASTRRSALDCRSRRSRVSRVAIQARPGTGSR